MANNLIHLDKAATRQIFSNNEMRFTLKVADFFRIQPNTYSTKIKRSRRHNG